MGKYVPAEERQRKKVMEELMDIAIHGSDESTRLAAIRLWLQVDEKRIAASAKTSESLTPGAKILEKFSEPE